MAMNTIIAAHPDDDFCKETTAQLIFAIYQSDTPYMSDVIFARQDKNKSP